MAQQALRKADSQRSGCSELTAHAAAEHAEPSSDVSRGKRSSLQTDARLATVAQATRL